MASETITRNDLTAILNEVLPADKNSIEVFEHDKFIYNSGFAAYSTGGDTNTPTATKYGKIVMLNGAYKTTVNQSTTGEKVIGKVPSGCYPSKDYRVISQGSGMNRFLLVIKTSGDMVVDRYATTTDTAIPNETWLNISCTYICS